MILHVKCIFRTDDLMHIVEQNKTKQNMRCWYNAVQYNADSKDPRIDID